jgi:hypothetical protein
MHPTSHDHPPGSAVVAVVAPSGSSHGAFVGMSRLHELAELIHSAPQASLIREAAQQEAENEGRLLEALVSRGNSLLAAAGVSIALVLGLARDTIVRSSGAATVLVVLALACATSCGLCAALGVRFRRDVPTLNDANIFAEDVAAEDEDEWRRRYLLMLALAYADLRRRLHALRSSRGRWLIAAQYLYVAFIGLVCALAITIVL